MHSIYFFNGDTIVIRRPSILKETEEHTFLYFKIEDRGVLTKFGILSFDSLELVR